MQYENEVPPQSDGSYYDRIRAAAGPRRPGGASCRSSGGPSVRSALRAGFVGLSIGTDRFGPRSYGEGGNALDCSTYSRRSAFGSTVHKGGVSRGLALDHGSAGHSRAPIGAFMLCAGRGHHRRCRCEGLLSIHEAVRKLISFEDDVPAKEHDVAVYQRQYRLYDMARKALIPVYHQASLDEAKRSRR